MRGIQRNFSIKVLDMSCLNFETSLLSRLQIRGRNNQKKYKNWL